jgi:general secretion pathway protein L
MIETSDLLQAARRMGAVARHALLWWRSELWHLLPRRLRQVLSADPFAVQIRLADAASEGQAVAIQTFRSGRPAQRLHMDEWRAALAWVAGQRRFWGPLMRIDVVLPAAWCLTRRREVPQAAGDRVREVLALELERATPFSAQDVRQDWRTVDGQLSETNLLVEHVVVKRYLSDPVLAEAKALGLPIAAVDVMDAAGCRMGVNLLERTEVPRPLAGRLNQAIAIAGALLIIASTAAGLLAVQRQEDALARLEADIGAAGKQAQGVRKRLQDAESVFERIERLRSRRAQDVRFIAVWEEVTRRLPDTAWLTDMRIENDALWLDGYARSASELVGIVAQSPMVSGVALSAPVTRDTAKAGERFQLRMKIENVERAPTARSSKSNG